MKKILIVEDNELNITILDGILSSTYELSIALSGEEMFTILKSQTPDLFLLDIVMEGKSGLDLCEELRSHETFKQIPIVFMTAVQDKSVYDAAFKAGADAFITKPFKASELKNALKNALS
jgi:CheY-like chemotaxis protein